MRPVLRPTPRQRWLPDTCWHSMGPCWRHWVPAGTRQCAGDWLPLRSRAVNLLQSLWNRIHGSPVLPWTKLLRLRGADLTMKAYVNRSFGLLCLALLLAYLPAFRLLSLAI